MARPTLTIVTDPEPADPQTKMYEHLYLQHRHMVLSDVDLIEFHDRLYLDCNWSTS